ncbi:hypothetical protein MKX03_020033 [Papaver bracteatum]|nr:hypothetical protein MKX03_020033 [Papaver bracteatum]
MTTMMKFNFPDSLSRALEDSFDLDLVLEDPAQVVTTSTTAATNDNLKDHEEVESVSTMRTVDMMPVVLIENDYSSNHQSCMVCMDRFPVGTIAKSLPCNHIFHDHCILAWLGQHNSCPLCRSEIVRDGGEANH